MSTKALARRLRQMQAGRPTFVTGTTLAAAAGGQVQVNVGSDRIVTAIVPGTFRTEVAAGVNVRMTRVENTHTIDSILDALPAPAVTASPSASGINPGANGTTSSGTYDYVIGTDDWNAVRAYTRDIATSTRSIAGDVNELRDDVDDNATDLASLKATVNSLRTTLEGLRAAMVAQGRIT